MKLLTIYEAAEYLRVSPSTIRRILREGSLPTVRLPGSRLVRINAQALADFVRSCGQEDSPCEDR